MGEWQSEPGPDPERPDLAGGVGHHALRIIELYANGGHRSYRGAALFPNTPTTPEEYARPRPARRRLVILGRWSLN